MKCSNTSSADTVDVVVLADDAFLLLLRSQHVGAPPLFHLRELFSSTLSQTLF